MSLFPLDAVRNAQLDREIELLLEDAREQVIRFPEWNETGLGSSDEILEAYDMARPRLNVLASLLLRGGAHACLDIGTGPGFLPYILTRLGIAVIATERDTRVAHFARSAGIEVREYRLGHGIPPFQPDSFDAVVIAEVLEHLKVPAIGAISELATVLRPGGTLLLTTPNVARLAHLEALAAGENFLEPFPEDLPPGEDPTDHIEHVREYSVREVVDSVESAGLEIRQVLMTGWGESGYNLLPNPYANEIIMVEAEK